MPDRYLVERPIRANWRPFDKLLAHQVTRLRGQAPIEAPPIQEEHTQPPASHEGPTRRTRGMGGSDGMNSSGGSCASSDESFREDTDCLSGCHSLTSQMSYEQASYMYDANNNLGTLSTDDVSRHGIPEVARNLTPLLDLAVINIEAIQRLRQADLSVPQPTQSNNQVVAHPNKVKCLGNQQRDLQNTKTFRDVQQNSTNIRQRALSLEKQLQNYSSPALVTSLNRRTRKATCEADSIAKLIDKLRKTSRKSALDPSMRLKAIDLSLKLKSLLSRQKSEWQCVGRLKETVALAREIKDVLRFVCQLSTLLQQDAKSSPSLYEYTDKQGRGLVNLSNSESDVSRQVPGTQSNPTGVQNSVSYSPAGVRDSTARARDNPVGVTESCTSVKDSSADIKDSSVCVKDSPACIEGSPVCASDIEVDMPSSPAVGHNSHAGVQSSIEDVQSSPVAVQDGFATPHKDVSSEFGKAVLRLEDPATEVCTTGQRCFNPVVDTDVDSGLQDSSHTNMDNPPCTERRKRKMRAKSESRRCHRHLADNVAGVTHADKNNAHTVDTPTASFSSARAITHDKESDFNSSSRPVPFIGSAQSGSSVDPPCRKFGNKSTDSPFKTRSMQIGDYVNRPIKFSPTKSSPQPKSARQRGSAGESDMSADCSVDDSYSDHSGSYIVDKLYRTPSYNNSAHSISCRSESFISLRSQMSNNSSQLQCWRNDVSPSSRSDISDNCSHASGSFTSSVGSDLHRPRLAARRQSRGLRQPRSELCAVRYGSHSGLSGASVMSSRRPRSMQPSTGPTRSCSPSPGSRRMRTCCKKKKSASFSKVPEESEAETVSPGETDKSDNQSINGEKDEDDAGGDAEAGPNGEDGGKSSVKLKFNPPSEGCPGIRNKTIKVTATPKRNEDSDEEEEKQEEDENKTTSTGGGLGLKACCRRCYEKVFGNRKVNVTCITRRPESAVDCGCPGKSSPKKKQKSKKSSPCRKKEKSSCDAGSCGDGSKIRVCSGPVRVSFTTKKCQGDAEPEAKTCAEGDLECELASEAAEDQEKTLADFLREWGRFLLFALLVFYLLYLILCSLLCECVQCTAPLKIPFWFFTIIYRNIKFTHYDPPPI